MPWRCLILLVKIRLHILLKVPSFFFAAVYWLLCSEPKRGGKEEEFQDINVDDLNHKISLEDIKLILYNYGHVVAVTRKNNVIKDK